MVNLLLLLWVLLLAWGIMRSRPRKTRPVVPIAPLSKPPWRARWGVVLLGRTRWAGNDIREQQAGGLVVAGPLILLWPPLMLVAMMVAWWLPLRHMRRLQLQREQAIVRELPDVVDLFSLAFSAGLTVPLATRAVANAGHGLVASVFEGAVDQVDAGLRWSEALHRVLDELGDPLRRLVRLLLDMLDGTDPVGIVEQIASETRVARQRRAEAAARRVPVRLLFPLVMCILPAFGLLTVVPLAAGSFQSLAT